MSNNKGKGRATERTPLLGSPSPSSSSSRPHRARVAPNGEFVGVPRRERICSHILTGCLALLSLLLIVLLFVTLIARPSAPSPSPEKLFDKSVHFRGPYRIDVINITDPLTTPDHVGGIWLRVDGDIFVDSDYILRQMAATGVTWWANLRLGVGRWLVRTIHNATVDLGTLDVVGPHAEAGAPPLVRVRLPKFNVPLEPNMTYEGAPYSPFSLPVLISPTRDVTALAQFAADSWNASAIIAKVKTKRASVYGGDLTPGPFLGGIFTWGWKGLLGVSVDKFKKSINVPIPNIPGLPDPGSTPMPQLSSLVTLLSYSLSSSQGSSNISMSATASMSNIFPFLNLPSTFKLTIPTTPIVVSLPVPLPNYHVARLNAWSGKVPPVPDRMMCYDPHNGTRSPLEFIPNQKYLPLARLSVPPQEIPPHRDLENITLSATGHLIPLRPSLNAMEALSPFLSAYLAGKPYNVLVTVDLPIVSSPGTGIERLIDPRKTLSFGAIFPAAKPRPRILQELTIREMRIRYGHSSSAIGLVAGKHESPPPLDGPIFEHAGEYTVLATGTVWARVVLPKQFDVETNVTRVWPDIILYDGPVPPDDGDDEEEEKDRETDPLPSPPQEVEPAPTWRVFEGKDGKARALAASGKVPDNKNKEKLELCPEPLPPYDPLDETACFKRPPRETPLPDPLPDAAFARIRTSEWLAAIASTEEDEDGRKTTIVQAHFEDVPVTVLPGREGRMRSFVSKAIFSKNGAEAGLNGVTAVAVVVQGLVVPREDDEEGDGEREVELHGLPVDGNVRVGGKLMDIGQL
ncbi:hypothetical protein EXIGLDRAFT_759502 [Exidia glandulosa HHB12029]|uniref:Uncharacterized protein n=1 Tax=Exidia glandulosa HHB12029 TaxID=1314781 RepID=A0A165PX80_EXIGL|nr:hypothetical protein EXIGLDRAFT_759502 [Exidia glandulosa HHB12029]